MMQYLNRKDAGLQLAEKLSPYANRDDVIVLALPRGGVPVAFEVAKALHAPLDVFIVRKLGVPGHSELAMGAIAMGGVTLFNKGIVSDLHISKEEIDTVIAKESQELQRRELAYRGTHTPPNIKHKTVILVDDGIATGASMHVAIDALRRLEPSKIIVAVPVAPTDASDLFSTIADEFICPLVPPHFNAVGQWYEDFTQTEDDEVHTLLAESRK
jgi:predicted phosphoribosyltransferase